MVKHYVRGDTYPVKEGLKALGCRWDGTERAWYTEDEGVLAQALALLAPAPLLNGPSPADLGTADPQALAARFGRAAVPGARVESRAAYGLARGDDGDPDGTVHVVRHRDGAVRRWLQVARTPRRYLSRDMLEDFDLFGEEPGGSYQMDVVEVVPTEEEQALDAAEAQEREEARRRKEEAAASARAEQEARAAAWETAVAGLVPCSERPEGITETGERLQIDAQGQTAAARFTLPDGRTGWRHEWHAYDDHRTTYFVPEDVLLPVALRWARGAGVTAPLAREWMAKYSGCAGAELYRAVAGLDEAGAAELEEAARQKKARDRAEKIAQERGSTERLARHLAAQLPGKPDVVEVRIDEAALEAYCDALLARQSHYDAPAVGLAGVVVVLRPGTAPVPAPRGRRKAPAPALPDTLRLGRDCTARVEVVS